MEVYLLPQPLQPSDMPRALVLSDIQNLQLLPVVTNDN